MVINDDDLIKFEAEGAGPLPYTNEQGYVENDGARIWYSAYGSGKPVILLHGGLGNSGNWGYQVPALEEAGYRVVVIDSRGHGRSTRDTRPYSYDLMATDVLAVADALIIKKAAPGGLERWSLHSLDPCCKIPGTGGRRVFLCMQYGPERNEGVCIHTDDWTMP